MATAAGAAAYFQRGSLFWFTVITLSFGYHTVRAPAGGPRSGQGPPAVNAATNFFGFRYWLAWLIHVGESLYAIVLCKQNELRIQLRKLILRDME
uniref:Transmembrane protein 254 n=1 Tax=Aotus nancymaae TaxID=37293 RepID=A0A2K5C873_AOTNA